jgi:hypothetical protein
MIDKQQNKSDKQWIPNGCVTIANPIHTGLTHCFSLLLPRVLRAIEITKIIFSPHPLVFLLFSVPGWFSFLPPKPEKPDKLFEPDKPDKQKKSRSPFGNRDLFTLYFIITI